MIRITIAKRTFYRTASLRSSQPVWKRGHIGRIINITHFPPRHLDLGNNPNMAAMPSATRKPQRVLPLQESRALMGSHFSEYSGSKYKEGWAELWEAGDFLPWDRMVPSPALTDTLDNWTQVIGTARLVLPDGSTRRKRALVPGCGRGVDVMLLQAYGYDVVGLEVSPKAVEAAELYAKETEGEELYSARDKELGKGSRMFVQGDFYADDWLETAGLSAQGTNGIFELIYDYTVSIKSVRPPSMLTCTPVLLRHAASNATSLGKTHVRASGTKSASKLDMLGVSDDQTRQFWWTSFLFTSEGIHGALEPPR